MNIELDHIKFTFILYCICKYLNTEYSQSWVMNSITQQLAHIKWNGVEKYRK